MLNAALPVRRPASTTRPREVWRRTDQDPSSAPHRQLECGVTWRQLTPPCRSPQSASPWRWPCRGSGPWGTLRAGAASRGAPVRRDNCQPMRGVLGNAARQRVVACRPSNTATVCSLPQCWPCPGACTPAPRPNRNLQRRCLPVAQFIMVWQRYSVYWSFTSRMRCSVKSSRLSMIHLHDGRVQGNSSSGRVQGSSSNGGGIHFNAAVPALGDTI